MGVGWVRLSVDLFDNPKIKYIELNSDGDAFVSLWLRLLCLAGRANDNGMVYVTKGVAYTPEILAAVAGKDVDIVKKALELFRKLNMVAVDEQGYIEILGWRKHQNTEGLERIKEQSRDRVKKWRENKKQSNVTDGVTSNVTDGVTSNVTGNVTVTLRNATDKNKNRKDKNRKEDDYHHLPKDDENSHTEIFALWEKNIMPLTALIGEKLKTLIGEVGEAAVEHGIIAAVEHGARNFSYVQTVARNFARGGKTPQKAQTDKANLSYSELAREMYGGKNEKTP